MLGIPSVLRSKFEKRLQDNKIALTQHYRCLKWLRYYLDFCSKYHNIPSEISSLSKFTKKLQEKNQTPFQQKEAACAVGLYFELLKEEKQSSSASQVTENSPREILSPNANRQKHGPDVYQYDGVTEISGQSTSLKKRNKKDEHSSRKAQAPDNGMKSGSQSSNPFPPQIKGASWKKEYSRLNDEIKLRHFSPKTFLSY